MKNEIKTIIDGGTLNNNEQEKPKDTVMQTTPANKIKIYQCINVDNSK
jgi:hypothetical protein